MTKLILVMQIYRDGDLAIKTLEPFLKHVEQVIILAGQVTVAPVLPKDDSIEKVSEFLRSRSMKHIVDYTKGLQMDIHQRGLDMVLDGDFIFWCETDRIPKGEIDRSFLEVRKFDYDAYRFGIKDDFEMTQLAPSFEYALLIWKKHDGDHYVDNHWTIHNNKDELYVIGNHTVAAPYRERQIRTMMFEHHPEYRDPIIEQRRRQRYAELREVQWDERLLAKETSGTSKDA